MSEHQRPYARDSRIRTLGIDLATKSQRTAACFVTWSNLGAKVELVERKLTDEALVELIGEADRVAIDAPFGWPDEFIEAIRDYAEHKPFPTTERKRLRYRETDRFVEQQARLPLSVSSDRIAVTAMRCASILTMLEESGQPVNRTGAGKVLEVYPASALAMWDIDPAGYKTGDKVTTARTRIIDGLTDGADGWLKFSKDLAARCVGSDDKLDAFISALVARAADKKLTLQPPDGVREQAEREGWIHLPTGPSLAALGR